MATFLDSIRIRKLANGFTVRYHIAEEEHSASTAPVKGEVKELYVADKSALATFVYDLINEQIS